MIERILAILAMLVISFAALAVDAPLQIVAAYSEDGRDILVVDKDLNLLASEDSGATWTLRGQVPTDGPEVLHAWFRPDLFRLPDDPDRLFLQRNTELWHSPDGGYSWTLLDSGNRGVLLIDATTPELLRISGGQLLVSGDGGLTWEVRSVLGEAAGQRFAWIYDLARDGADPEILYASGVCGYPQADAGIACLLISRDAGRTWPVQSFGSHGAHELATRTGAPGVWGAFRLTSYLPPSAGRVSWISPEAAETRFQDGDAWAIALASFMGASHLVIAGTAPQPTVRVVVDGDVQLARGLPDIEILQVRVAPGDRSRVLGVTWDGALYRSNNGGLDWHHVPVAEGGFLERPEAIPTIGPVGLVIMALGISLLAMSGRRSRNSVRP